MDLDEQIDKEFDDMTEYIREHPDPKLYGTPGYETLRFTIDYWVNEHQVNEYQFEKEYEARDAVKIMMFVLDDLKQAGLTFNAPITKWEIWLTDNATGKKVKY